VCSRLGIPFCFIPIYILCMLTLVSLFYRLTPSPIYYLTLFDKINGGEFLVFFFWQYHFLVSFLGSPLGGGGVGAEYTMADEQGNWQRYPNIALFDSLMFSGGASWHEVFGFIYLYKMFNSTCMYFTHLISRLRWLLVIRMVCCGVTRVERCWGG